VTDQPSKRCPRCGESLPLYAFGPDTGTASGLRVWCRLCVNKSAAERRERYRQQNLTARNLEAADKVRAHIANHGSQFAKVETSADVQEDRRFVPAVGPHVGLMAHGNYEAHETQPTVKDRAWPVPMEDEPTKPGGGAILFVPDLHAPYHDRKAWALVLQAARLLKPSYVHLAGDMIDCYAVSQHEKSLNRLQDFKYEIDGANEALDELAAAAKGATFIYTEGNHEYRWPRYLSAMAPQAGRLPGSSMKDLLRIKERGWIWVPYREFYKLGKLYLTHDLEKSGVNAVRQALSDAQASIVIGHLHRMSVVYGGDAMGNTHVAACFGWLGGREDVDYKHRLRANREWQLGFGVGQLLESGNVHLSAVPIVDYECVVAGKLLRAA